MGRQTLEARSIPEILIEGAERWPDRTAVVFPDFEWTFERLHRESVEVARGLVGLGVQPGDHVATLLPNGADFLRGFFGAALAGAVVVPLNARYRKADLAYALAQSDATALLISTQSREYFDFEPVVEEIRDSGQASDCTVVVVLGADSSRCFVDEAGLAAAAAAVDPGEVARRARLAGLRQPGIMLYTSGTTGDPKAAVLSHEAVVRTSLGWGREGIGMSPDDSIWIPNPLFHVGALHTLIASLGAGARFLSMPFFDPDGAVEMLSRHAVTLFFPVFDAVALPIIEHPRASDLRFENVRTAFVIGNPMNVNRVKRALPGIRFINVYGMTETASWCVLNFDDEGEFEPQAGGRPIGGVEVRVCSAETGAEAPPGELGTIQVRSWCTLTEYYKNPEATAKAIDADGWFDTGDLGEIIADGSLRWRGRSGERIRVGGENVAPMEIEKHLGLHPAVRICAVVGIPDQRLGEVPAAFLELYPGSESTQEEIIAHCEGAIARFKVPRYVRFLAADEWPMSTTKIKKPDLRVRLIEELEIEIVDTTGAASR
jgi:acyl-CoA synthetase (AMP-forming)/AMP-acid ligase II